MDSIVYKLDTPVNHESIKQKSRELIESSKKEMSVENLKLIMSLIDLTTLSVTDNEERVKKMCEKVEVF